MWGRVADTWGVGGPGERTELVRTFVAHDASSRGLRAEGGLG